MHISSSALLFVTVFLQAIYGSAVVESTEEQQGGSLVPGGRGDRGEISGIGRNGGDDAGMVMPGSSFLQQAYRVQELQAEFHADYKLIRFNIADMQRLNIAWCPVTVVKPVGGWHACLLYQDSPQYIMRDQLLIFNATWRPEDVREGPVTFPLQIVTDSQNTQTKAVGQVTIQCRNKRCRATPEQEERNILHWEGRGKPIM